MRHIVADDDRPHPKVGKHFSSNCPSTTGILQQYDVIFFYSHRFLGFEYTVFGKRKYYLYRKNTAAYFKPSDSFSLWILSFNSEIFLFFSDILFCNLWISISRICIVLSFLSLLYTSERCFFISSSNSLIFSSLRIISFSKNSCFVFISLIISSYLRIDSLKCNVSSSLFSGTA